MISAVMVKGPSLLDRLRCCSTAWADANNATLARLGRSVINDGGFFTRIDQPGASTTTATLERFAKFFCDPANWPDGSVPEEVCVFAHVVGVTPAGICSHRESPVQFPTVQ